MVNGLSANQLKIIAAVCMVIDHIGLMFYPTAVWMRTIGRLALPIFAFFIAEGCFYTKSRLRYFSLTFGLGVICQIVYFVALKRLYMCILITFSLGLILSFAYQDLKNAVYRTRPFSEITGKAVLFIGALVTCFYLNENYQIDYSFYGCILPLFFSVVMPVNEKIPLIEKNNKIDLLNKTNLLPLRLIFAIIPIVLIADMAQLNFYYYALVALLFLLFYSGERGKINMKYFFYVFYPLHLVVLQGIDLII